MTTKQQAENLFFNSELTQQQIADTVGINRKTLYDWKQQGNWLRARCVTSNAPMVLCSQYYEQLAALNVDIADRDIAWPTKDEANIIGKLNNTIRTLRRDGKTKADATEILTNFSELLREKDPELNDKIADYIEEFLKTTESGWYKDQLRRKRQEQRYEKEYREYAANIFERESNLLREEANLAAEAALPGFSALEARSNEKALAEANARRAAAKANPAPTRDLRPTSSPLERSGEAPQSTLQSQFQIPNSEFPNRVQMGSDPKKENPVESAPTATFTENTPHPNTPKNISQQMGPSTNHPTKQSQFPIPNSQFLNPRPNRSQRRKLEREAAKKKLKAA